MGRRFESCRAHQDSETLRQLQLGRVRTAKVRDLVQIRDFRLKSETYTSGGLAIP